MSTTQELIQHEISQMTETEKTIALNVLTEVVCERGSILMTGSNMLTLVLSTRKEYALAVKKVQDNT